jgi:hypothetical protein
MARCQAPAYAVAMYRPVPSDPPWRIRRRVGAPPPAGRRWAAVALGDELIVLGLALAVWAAGGERPLVLTVAVAILLSAPYVIAKISGHRNWPLAGVGAVAGFLVAYGLLFPVDDLLPTLTVAVGLGGAIALAWRKPMDLLFRAGAVAALGGAAFAAALVDVRALVWATIVLALPVVALADELARRTGRR